MTREKWLAMRKNFIGGSDAPVIVNGVHFGKTPYKLWLEKLGLGEEQPDNPAMKRGRELEEVAREKVSQRMGIDFQPGIVFHSEKKFMMATLDGLSPDENHAIEIKCPSRAYHAMASKKKVPPHYMAQLQHQMACAGLDCITYVSYHNTFLTYFDVKRNESYVKKMVEQEEEFWGHVESLDPPDMNEHDYFNIEIGQTKERRKWHTAVKELRKVTALKRVLNEREEEAKEVLKAISDGRNVVGFGAKLTSYMCRGAIDYKSIPILEEIDLEKHRKPPSPRVRITLDTTNRK